MQHKLGTCCQILDDKGKQYKDTIIGTVQQTTLDKILDQGLFDGCHKVVTQNPNIRVDIMENDSIKFKQCQDKVLSKVKQNLQALKKQLQHVSDFPEEMQMFRISSNLLPMFDHPQYNMLYTDKLKQVVENGLSSCKKIIDQHNIVVTCHPDQWNKINSDSEKVRSKTFTTLEYHRYFMEQLTTSDRSCINIHVDGKLDHIPEFDNGLYQDLIPWLSFENDDTTPRAGVLQTLDFCQRYNIKMVYDIHHDLCENSGKRLHIDDDRIMASVINTWQDQTPIFHVSDSRDPGGDTPKKLSPHSDYINSPEVVEKARMLLELGHVEVEAKAKNLSCFKLLHDLSEINSK